MSSLLDFATWEPLLRLLRTQNAQNPDTPMRLKGQIGRDSWNLSRPRGRNRFMQETANAVKHVQSAFMEDGLDGVSFTAEIWPGGRTRVNVYVPGPAVENGLDSPTLILDEGSVPEPWRRLPVPAPDAAPAPSADPALLERTLRDRLDDPAGATEAEITAAETRLGVALPDELKALYRVTRGRRQDWSGDHAAVGCELLPLDEVFTADAASRPRPWRFAAKEAVVTPPDAAVQGVVGSPGWIVFGGDGGGDLIAADLTPGPRGRRGQIIVIDHEKSTGAHLLADSLTDLVTHRPSAPEPGRRSGDAPVVARVNTGALTSVRAAAHPELEVLSIGVWEGDPLSLAPVVGLPRLRTLTAYPGTLADPLEIADLTGLEFLELGEREWRVLLDADAVPRSLSAAAITAGGGEVIGVANELLALWGRPPITRTTFEGRLDPEV